MTVEVCVSKSENVLVERIQVYGESGKLPSIFRGTLRFRAESPPLEHRAEVRVCPSRPLGIKSVGKLGGSTHCSSP